MADACEQTMNIQFSWKLGTSLPDEQLRLLNYSPCHEKETQRVQVSRNTAVARLT
jgi:hypothetical protein